MVSAVDVLEAELLSEGHPPDAAHKLRSTNATAPRAPSTRPTPMRRNVRPLRERHGVE
jgi:hypothetical protein